MSSRISLIRSQIFLVVLLQIFFLGCFNDSPHVAGGGSGFEYTNGTVVVGQVFTSDGAPAVNARVTIRPSNFLLDTGLAGMQEWEADGYTDRFGRFHLDSLPFGSYVLEARDNARNEWSLGFEAYGRLTELAPDTLRLAGGFQGKLENGKAAIIRIYGLNRAVKADDAGAFFIPDLPPGSYGINITSPQPGLGFNYPGRVTIRSGEITRMDSLRVENRDEEDYSTWSHSRRIRVHAMKAGIMETVYDFPLLVRIYNSNIDFSQSDGKDLRFSDADGRHLTFEIERWEPASRLAEAWVKFDSIPAGSDSFEVTLHWGKPNAANFSNGGGVFSSFAGVWHMSEAQWGSDSGAFRDAAAFSLTAQGFLQAGNRRAVWGYSGLFQGNHFLHTIGHDSLKPKKALFISAWIQPTATDKDGGEILSMGDNYVLRVNPDGSPRLIVFDDPAWDGLSPAITKKWKISEATGFTILDQRWHYVVGVFDGEFLRLYLDGIERSVQMFHQNLAYPLGPDFWIGRNGDGDRLHDFFGQIDEVQISGKFRSAAWIKLAYENQKPGSTLLEYR
jgi:hypothetical protein